MIHELPGWAMTLLGSSSGAALALIYDQPRSWRDLLRRSVFSVAVGALSADLVREHYLHWPETGRIAAAAAIAALSWSVFGVVLRLINALTVSDILPWKKKG